MSTTTRPEPGLAGRDEEELLLRAAVAAPSFHNTQPWQFAVASDRVEVYADPSRQLRHADPSGRSLLISVGAAVFNLRVAGEHLGFQPTVRLAREVQLPGPAPVLVATVDLGRRTGAGELAPLFPAVAARRTNRLPFDELPVALEILANLVDAAESEGAVLSVHDDPEQVGRIVGLLRSAEIEERTDVARPGERAAWVGGPGRHEGVPVASLGPLPDDPEAAFRDLGAGIDVPRATAAFERAPMLAVLATFRDGAMDWVEAGQALQRVLLVATAAGVAASFMNQPLEDDELRTLVLNPEAGAGHPQMILRLGYGDPVPATPRRPVSAVRRGLSGPP